MSNANRDETLARKDHAGVVRNARGRRIRIDCLGDRKAHIAGFRSSPAVFASGLQVDPASWESSYSIYIASKPDTTPEGKFHEENVVDSDFFFTEDPREWSPTSPLYAGRRWWIVGSLNDETYDTSFSTPREFTVAPTAKIVSLGVRRYAFLRNLDFTVRWRSNARRPIVTASISTLERHTPLGRRVRLSTARSERSGRACSLGMRRAEFAKGVWFDSGPRSALRVQAQR